MLEKVKNMRPSQITASVVVVIWICFLLFLLVGVIFDEMFPELFTDFAPISFLILPITLLLFFVALEQKTIEGNDIPKKVETLEQKNTNNITSRVLKIYKFFIVGIAISVVFLFIVGIFIL